MSFKVPSSTNHARIHSQNSKGGSLHPSSPCPDVSLGMGKRSKAKRCRCKSRKPGWKQENPSCIVLPCLSPSSIQKRHQEPAHFHLHSQGEQGQLQPHPQQEPSDQINKKPLMATAPLLLWSPAHTLTAPRKGHTFLQHLSKERWRIHGSSAWGQLEGAASTHSALSCGIAPGYTAQPSPGTHPQPCSASNFLKCFQHGQLPPGMSGSSPQHRPTPPSPQPSTGLLQNSHWEHLHTSTAAN